MLVEPQTDSIVFEVIHRIKVFQEQIPHQKHLAGISWQVVLVDLQKALLRTADEQVLTSWYLKDVARQHEAHRLNLVLDLVTAQIHKAKHVMPLAIEGGYDLSPLRLKPLKHGRRNG